MESLISDYRSFLFVICGCLRFEQNGMRLPLGIVILVCVSLDSLSQLNIPHFWIHVSNGWTPLLHLIAMCRLEITRYCEFKKTRSIPIGIATLLTYENLHDFCFIEIAMHSTLKKLIHFYGRAILWLHLLHLFHCRKRPWLYCSAQPLFVLLVNDLVNRVFLDQWFTSREEVFVCIDNQIVLDAY